MGPKIPVVDTVVPKEGKVDRRKGRSVRWQEARLCFARSAKAITPVLYATMGDVERAGDLLYLAAQRVDLGPKKKFMDWEMVLNG